MYVFVDKKNRLKVVVYFLDMFGLTKMIELTGL